MEEMMKKFLALMIATMMVVVAANAAKKTKNKFVVSFGDGGYKSYKVIDNSCYVYTLAPKSLKDAPKALNSAITASLVNAGKQYSKKADAFINIKVYLTPYKNAIIYQVCGDVIKASKRRR